MAQDKQYPFEREICPQTFESTMAQEKQFHSERERFHPARISNVEVKKKSSNGFLAMLTSAVMLGTGLVAMSVVVSQRSFYAQHDITTSVVKRFDNVPLHEAKYRPSRTEDYLLKHATELGYHNIFPGALPDVCTIWNNTGGPLFKDLTAYREELRQYNSLVKGFQPINDLRLRLRNENHEDVCPSVELKKGGLYRVFSESHLSHSNIFGYVEPLLAPLRHPEFCFSADEHLFDLTYLVHDFVQFCRQLKPTSRIVLFDLGASLEFSIGSKYQNIPDYAMPAVYLTKIYKKFGMPFDHIYALEITQIPPSRVYESVPEELLSAYHWINVPVSPDPASKLHPFEMILKNFNPDDFIVVKLDIDTPRIEMKLVNQLLTNYSHIVDQFYFEHHVKMNPLNRYWGRRTKGSAFDSLRLFQSLREKGVGSHSWV